MHPQRKKTFPFASASPYPDNVQINSINKQDILLSAMDDPFQAGFKYLQADFLTEWTEWKLMAAWGVRNPSETYGVLWKMFDIS